MAKEKYRLRDKQLSIRVTDYEYALMMKRMKEVGAASMTEYIIDAATNGYLIHVDYSEMKNLAYEINKIGNNINQIAHKINSENMIFQSEIEEIQEDIGMIWKMIRARFYQMP